MNLLIFCALFSLPKNVANRASKSQLLESQKLLGHPGSDLVRVAIRQVGVSFDHLERFVPEDLRDFSQGRSAHGEVRGGCVPEIMEAEIFKLGPPDCGTPGIAGEEG